jgi:hypothetical protein
LIELTDLGAVERTLLELVELEEAYFFAVFHQKVQKAFKKDWFDRNIKKNKFKTRDLVFLYDNKFS